MTRGRNSLRWGLSPGPSVYTTDALPLSYRGPRSVAKLLARRFPRRAGLAASGPPARGAGKMKARTAASAGALRSHFRGAPHARSPRASRGAVAVSVLALAP